MPELQTLLRWNAAMNAHVDLSQRRPLSIGVLVLNYNTWELALRALNAAIRLEPESVSEFVLFDDGSSAPPPAGIDPRITVVRGNSNVGFARALQLAFPLMECDIVVLFDSDAYPLTPFANVVREHFELDSWLGQLGFRAEDENGSQSESFFAEPTQWSLILGQALYSRVPKRALRPSNLCVITGCMATRIEAYRNIGGFDPELNFLDVDVDYSMRMRRCGWKIEVDSSIKAFHIGGGTVQAQRNRVLHFYASRWHLLRKHKVMWSPRLARAVILARLMCERSILILFGRRLFPNPEVLEDKLLGRKALLSLVRGHLHSE
jgi:GT2 family glycosyltransferase